MAASSLISDFLSYLNVFVYMTFSFFAFRMHHFFNFIISCFDISFDFHLLSFPKLILQYLLPLFLSFSHCLLLIFLNAKVQLGSPSGSHLM